MTDQIDLLTNTQASVDEAYAAGRLGVADGEFFQDDEEGETFRFVKIENTVVTATVVFGALPALPHLPHDCPATKADRIAWFQISYEVRAGFRNAGRATNAIGTAISLFKSELAERGITLLCLVATVIGENEPSHKLAASMIAPRPVDVVEGDTGLPAKQYRGFLRCAPPPVT